MLCLYHVCSDVVISSFPLVNSVEVEEHCVMSEWLRLVMTCGTADRIMRVSKPGPSLCRVTSVIPS